MCSSRVTADRQRTGVRRTRQRVQQGVYPVTSAPVKQAQVARGSISSFASGSSSSLARFCTTRRLLRRRLWWLGGVVAERAEVEEAATPVGTRRDPDDLSDRVVLGCGAVVGQLMSAGAIRLD